MAQQSLPDNPSDANAAGAQSSRRRTSQLARPSKVQKDGAWRKPVHTPGSVTADAGLSSSGARTTTLTSSPMPLYIDSAGKIGLSASTRAKKNITSDYAVDMQKFLAIGLKNWSYLADPTATGMGPIADDLDAAGLKEFVIYSPVDGSIMGVRTDMLLIGLWSAYVQSRTSTLARLAKQQHVTVNQALASMPIGGSQTVDVVWPSPYVPFADSDYFATAQVTTPAGLLATATAIVVAGSKTVTGCKVTVTNTGVTLGSNMTLTTEALHV